MIYFTADQHFYHNNIIRYCSRPYATVEEMNECMVKEYNSIVKPDDTVYMLGDFSMAFRPVELFLPRLMGHKHLIMGNHDFCHPAHKKGKKDPEGWKQKYLDLGFESVQESLMLELPHGEKLLLHHMPYKGDHTQLERYSEYRPHDIGLWLLHGHVHDLWLVNGRMINVGVDQWDRKPVSLDEVLELRDMIRYG